MTATRPTFELRLPRGDVLRLDGTAPCCVMGVLNVTADSFSDGGRFLDPDAAVAHAEEMAGEGAGIIDVGGESTRPGSAPVPAEEQRRRVLPVIERIASRIGVPISIDTSSADVARHALDAGAQIVNDVTALRGDAAMGALVEERGAPLILMHMLGTPRNMQRDPRYDDVVGEIAAFLDERVRAAEACGVARDQIAIDPGFGFGKALAHNLDILYRLEAFQALGRPVLAGTSRKAMLGAILDRPVADRLHGTLATVAAAIERGASIVRVHDVQPAVDVARVMAAVHGRAPA